MGSRAVTDRDPPTLTEMADRVPSRQVVVRPRTLVAALATVVGVAVVAWVALASWQVLTWIVIAALLAVALPPPVDALTRRGVRPASRWRSWR